MEPFGTQWQSLINSPILLFDQSIWSKSNSPRFSPTHPPFLAANLTAMNTSKEKKGFFRPIPRVATLRLGDDRSCTGQSGSAALKTDPSVLSEGNLDLLEKSAFYRSLHSPSFLPIDLCSGSEDIPFLPRKQHFHEKTKQQ